MTAILLRQHKKLLLIFVAALSLVFLVTSALIVSRLRHLEQTAGGSRPGETPAPAGQPALPTPTPPSPAIPSDTSAWQPQRAAPQMAVGDGSGLGGSGLDRSNPANQPSTGSIDPQAVQEALNRLAHNAERGDSSPQQLPRLAPQQAPQQFRQQGSEQPAAPSAVASSSDRYPGSQPVEVKDANLPDIGIPVASEVYTTSDSVATVTGYYRRRYPDAEVSEMDGQKIVAVDQPGATKVIAIGTTGSETRIAIVQPGN